MGAGELTLLSAPETSSLAGEYSFGINVTGDGLNVYACGGSRSNPFINGFASQFKRDPTTGILTPFSTLTLECRHYPNDIVSCATLPFVYVLDSTNGFISIFKRGSEGALTLVEDHSINNNAFNWTLAMSPDDKNLYVGREGQFGSKTDGSILQLKINPATGELTAPGPGETVSTTEHSLFYERPVIVSPDGKFVFATGIFSNNIGRLTRGGEGALSWAEGTALGESSEPASVVMSPSGKFIYIQCSKEETKCFSVSEGGVLTALSPAAIKPTTGGLKRHLAFTPDEKFAYAIDGARIAQYAYDGTTGLFTPLSTTSIPVDESEAAMSATALMISPDGKQLYAVANGTTPETGLVYQYNTNISGGGGFERKLLAGMA